MNDSTILKRIRKDIANRKKLNLFRVTANFSEEGVIDLSTNSYLSLHKRKEVFRMAVELADNNLHGNLSSRLIGTYSPLYDILEHEIADWKQAESALVFNSGYSANTCIISAVASRETEIFSDRLNHASIIDGIKLSGAKMTRYAHCDADDLYKKLSTSTSKEKLIITDSVFSMDGDIAPIAEICDIAEKYGAMIMVDEAHAEGILGDNLCGAVEFLNLGERVDIVMGTLSKSIAGLGGYFSGSAMLRDCFVNSARSLIYSTALPHSILAWNIAAIRFIRRNTYIGRELAARSETLRRLIREIGFNTLNSATQIIPCVTGSETEALMLSRYLADCGIKAPAIRPPAVPQKTARIRFSVSHGLTENDIARVAFCLKGWKGQNGR
jgi:8-amino-7-oxononanoate synthase